ncbi:MAG: hypothetical protein A2005_09860 [Desulfuromonadales bacterium GWC2_61_20]|nr:MAG: hypothetical protein A2005_09860 [Desulfuromonadales bacterium GWC2_61_20]HAD04110.1 hypothetical protein [Desulfuromonas sp.]
MSPINLPATRKIGHLTILRQPRVLSPREFNALTFAERLDMVRQAPAREKYALLIEAVDLEALIEALPAQELYLLVQELGPEDVPEILPLVTAAQMTIFLDLDCWRGDQMQIPAVLRWLALLLETGEEKTLAIARDIDPGMLALMLRKLVRVVHGPEDIDDEDLRASAVFRDGGYELEYLEPKAARLVATLLGILMRHDPPLFHRIIEGVRWELEAMLEEDVYEARSMRLLDQGFPDPQRVREIFSWLDPDSYKPLAEKKIPPGLGGDGGIAPGFPLAVARANDLLAAVLAAGLSESQAWELVALANKVMVADGIEVGNPDEVRTSVEGALALLNLALEHYSDGDPQRAREIFAGAYLEDLFRAGFGLLLRLQRRARALAKAEIFLWYDAAHRACIEGLRRERPVFFVGMVSPERVGERPFASRADLALAEAWLNTLEIQQQLFAGPLAELVPPSDWDLGGCIPAARADLTLSTLFLTALANRLCGRPFTPEPLPVQELVALHRLVSRDGHVDDTLRRETVRWVEELLPGAGPFAEAAFDEWQEGFCAVSEQDLDPHYIGGLILRLR